MRKLSFLIFFLSFFLSLTITAQTTHSLKVRTTVSDHVKNQFSPDGRLFLFISSSGREPRYNTWPNPQNKIFALNLKNWDPAKPFLFDGSVKLTKSVAVALGSFPDGDYRVQVLWDQNTGESDINAPGNLYSRSIEVRFQNDTTLELPLDQIVGSIPLIDDRFVKLVDIKSNVVSDFWKKEKRIRASVLLPSGYYDHPETKYPVRYNIAGYGGRYTRINQLMREGSRFRVWWMSGNAPQVINVFLDGEGPFGDCYQLDSPNSGPYGTALTKELIPFIEKSYHAIGTPESRFLDGCSTGGYVSLALQIFYPDFFNGCFSFSPDPVDFEYFQLIDIYKDKNAFYNEYGYLRPLMRDVTGDPRISQKDFVQFENVLGTSNTYLNSGGQFCAFTALFSPKGDNGLPVPLFDPDTGIIDHKVAQYWEQHDLKRYVENNWETLGPKLHGKIWIWMGDMDNYYLNTAMHSFDRMLKSRTNPESDAVINFAPMEGHCQEYDQIQVLNMIAEKWKKEGH